MIFRCLSFPEGMSVAAWSGMLIDWKSALFELFPSGEARG
jgi:hypothetical protein